MGPLLQEAFLDALVKAPCTPGWRTCFTSFLFNLEMLKARGCLMLLFYRRN